MAQVLRAHFVPQASRIEPMTMQFLESSDTDRGAGVDLDEVVHIFQAVTIVLHGKAADFEL
jgi:hypothetical protein